MALRGNCSIWPALFMGACLAAAGSSCADQKPPVSRETTAMDTFLSVTLYDQDLGDGRADQLIDSAIAEIRRIEALATDYSDESEVGIINRSAGTDTVTVSSQLLGMVRTSIGYSDKSAAAFDVTVGPLVKLWNFTGDHPRVPTAAQIDSALRLVGYGSVAVEGDRVFLRIPGMRLDLGGIAKGFAVDRAIDLLRGHGVRHALVDLGGNLGVYWEGTEAFDSTVAEISIRDPRKDGSMFGQFRIGSAGIATSGDYQRFFMVNGVRYHHLLDPRTGYPAGDVVSVTIVAERAMDADALSTAVFVLGRTRGMQLIESLSGVEGLIIVESGDTLSSILSSGFRGFIREQGGHD